MPKPDPGKERYWRTVIADCEASGLSQSEYCRQHKINSVQMRNWKKRLKQRRVVTKVTPTISMQHAIDGAPVETELLTRRQAAEYLGISEQTLAIWKCQNRYSLPVIKVGRLAKYKRSDLDRFLSKRTVDTTADPEFAQVKVVDRQSQKSPGLSEESMISALEVVLPSGVRLRLSDGCSSHLLSSVITLLENR